MTRSLLARLRASAGQLALLAALTVVAGVLLTGAPRVANDLTDQALRQRIESLPYQVKDLTYSADNLAGGFLPHHAADRLRQQRDRLGPALTSRIDSSLYTVTAPAQTTLALDHGLTGRARFGVRTGNEYQQRTRLVDGRWPQNGPGLPRIEVVVSELSAQILNFKVGTDYAITSSERPLPPLKMRVVGIFAAQDPQDAIWDTEPYLLNSYIPQDDNESYLNVMLTDVAGMDLVAQHNIRVDYAWRYHLGLSTLDMVTAPDVIKAVLESRKLGVGGTSAVTGLDTALARFADGARSAQALFAVVQAGTLATLGGLVLLASRLGAIRRRPEFVLLRARGASLRAIGGQTIAETLCVVPFAIVAGYYLGRMAPGRPAATELILAGFAFVALLALPVMAMGTLRTMSFSEERDDLASARIGLKRRTAELSLLAVAALGVVLLRRRGLSAGIDFYLITVPVLLATGAAILTLRVVPAPLGWVSRLASRARGAVGFLGFARAGRSAPATVGPIAVLVVAVCTTVFSLAIAGTVDAGRDRAADHDLPADTVVQGYFFADDTADELSRVPGVTAVARFAGLPTTHVRTSADLDAKDVGQVFLLLVDGPRFAEVARASGRVADLSDTIVNAQRSETPPALISSGLAERLGGKQSAALDLQGRTFSFQVAGVVDTYPVIARTANQFVVLPWQALPLVSGVGGAIHPTGFLVAGDADSAQLQAAGDAGQLRWISSIADPRPGYKPTTKVVAWADRRAQLESTGVNSVLTFAFSIGAIGGVLMALLAVGFAVLAGARTRGKILSRLRTMGLTRRQGRRLLILELGPVVTVAVLTGGVVGLALPRLIAPALNLTSFTDGYDAGLQLDPAVIGGSLGLIIAGLGTALLVETIFNRRLRLGEVLRLGSAE
ncbi:membrane protein [Rhizocola hellebori]|uniref:Membrane protein n=1 Tax=Rhizocola hellebori TaxID=1392758 RepID=A0A8J3QHD7_9ACTN|nr:FtsX-like permease family protein [Rhizocola hellebori]GIH09652.1 membrane protein [Rhizocola hellebori]